MSATAFLSALIALLDQAGIAHMVAGSLASTYYAAPRTTRDIDIVIDPTPAPFASFLQALASTGYYVNSATAARALELRSAFNVIDPASGWKIDLIIRRDRLFSEVEFSRRRRARLAGVPVWVATAEDTILAKLEWAAIGESDRQLRDAAEVLAALHGQLDGAYLDRWSEELGVRSLLDRVRRGE